MRRVTVRVALEELDERAILTVDIGVILNDF